MPDSRPIPPPPLDPRTAADFAAQTQALAVAYTTPGDGPAPWNPPASADGTGDVGYALIRVFATMMSQLAARLNQALENHHRAFVSLVGGSPLPVEAARAALTFSLAASTAATPPAVVVPAGAQVSASAAGALPEAIFSTEEALCLTRAQLRAVMLREPSLDQLLDATSATVAVPILSGSIVGGVAVEHVLYFACDSVFTLPAARVTVTLAGTGEANLGAARLDWSYSADGQSFTSLMLAAPSLGWTTSFDRPALLQAISIDGSSAAWIRLVATGPLASSLPTVTGMSASATVNRAGLLPDRASCNTAPIDLTKDFQPLGRFPELGDAFYLASAQAFSQPGAVVTLTITPSRGVTATPTNLDLLWEIATGGGWSALAPTCLPGGVSNVFGPGQSTLQFTVPAGAAPLSINGQSSYWVRARITQGNYTVPAVSPAIAVSSPPVLQSVRVGYSLTARSGAVTCRRKNDGVFDDVTGKGSFTPFVAVADSRSALYLGFDRPFENQPISLYLRVDPPSTQEVAFTDGGSDGHLAPLIAWEYLSGANGYRDLHVTDATGGFSASDLLRFIGPTDQAAGIHFGKNLYWLRARLARDASSPPSPPRRLLRVVPNTVWAENARAVADELLGSSNGAPRQTFTLSCVPVLAGAVVEVNEAAGWTAWTAVRDFLGSGTADRHYLLDHAAGTITFGDGVSGMIPPLGTQSVRATYRANFGQGGGLIGNRPARSIDKLKSSVPCVSAVTNHDPASGGADAEGADGAKLRCASSLRHGGYAVALRDYIDLAYDASSAVARATAVPPTFDPIAAGDSSSQILGRSQVVVIVVPRASEAQPVPGLQLLAEVRGHIAARCAPAVDLHVAGPSWAAVGVRATLHPTSPALGGTLSEARSRVAAFLHPLTGGREGAGWDFGQQPYVSDFYELLARVPGVAYVDSVSLDCPSPMQQDPTLPTQSLALARLRACTLICNGDHAITLGEP